MLETTLMAASALVVAFVLSELITARAASHAAPRRCVAPTPVDEAERILTGRFARGEITFEEYDRMRTILRR